MSHSSISRIVMGKINPTLPTIQKIAKALGKSLEYFDEDFNPLEVREKKVPYGFRKLPLLKNLPVGTRDWANGDVVEWVYLPGNFLGKYKHVFLTRAVGNSMEGAGIFEGDLVAVASDKEVNSGEIVVAVVNNEVLIRRYRKFKRKVRLEPANPKYASEEYRDRHQVDIKGVVIWSCRKYV